MDITQTKRPWKSKAIIGCFVSLLSIFLQAKGLGLSPEDKKVIVEVVFRLMEIGGILFAIFGRVTANTKIVLK